jgi:hypothetical protein
MDMISKKYSNEDEIDNQKLEALVEECLIVTPADIRFRELENAIREI